MNDRQLIEDLLSALEYHTEQTRPIQFSTVAIEAAREYLRKPEQPAQQEPVAEVKAKMTGGNVGIATVIHEIRSPLREPLQPGDKLYPAFRWFGWDVEQVWSERIFGIDMRFENMVDAIAFRKKLDEFTTPPAPAREPLTVEHIKDVAASCMWWVREQDILDDAVEFARAIEAKLRERDQ